MKKILIILGVLIIIILAYKIYNAGRYTIKNKEDVMEYVAQDKQQLEDIVKLIESFGDKFFIIDKTYEDSYLKLNNGNVNKMFYKYKLAAISNFNDTKMINFRLDRYKQNTSYWGFYYVEDNLPRGYFRDDELVPEGDGFLRDEYPVRYYTEKITDNWYYYEAYWYHGLDL